MSPIHCLYVLLLVEEAHVLGSREHVVSVAVVSHRCPGEIGLKTEHVVSLE